VRYELRPSSRCSRSSSRDIAGRARGRGPRPAAQRSRRCGGLLGRGCRRAFELGRCGAAGARRGGRGAAGRCGDGWARAARVLGRRGHAPRPGAPARRWFQTPGRDPRFWRKAPSGPWRGTQPCLHHAACMHETSSARHPDSLNFTRACGTSEPASVPPTCAPAVQRHWPPISCASTLRQLRAGRRAGAAQATEFALHLAQLARKPFAIVPCCVHAQAGARAWPARMRVDGSCMDGLCMDGSGLVGLCMDGAGLDGSCTEGLCMGDCPRTPARMSTPLRRTRPAHRTRPAGAPRGADPPRLRRYYLAAADPAIRVAELPLEGRNRVVYCTAWS